MVSSSFYPGLIIGGLVGAIVLRILRYKALKGGEIYEKVRYPREDGDDRGYIGPRESIPEGTHTRGSESSNGEVVSPIKLPGEQDVSGSIHLGREQMETTPSRDDTKDMGTKPNSLRQALRNRLRNRKGGN